MTSGKLYCPIRRVWIEGLPEEEIRQALIRKMIDELGFPKECLAAEKAVHQMPHLSSTDIVKVPFRRVDLVCFAKNIHKDHALYPLLLVECKAVKITQAVIRQIVGYNHYIRSFFIAIANRDEIRAGWFDPIKGEYQFVSYLPSFLDLCQSISYTKTH